MNNYNQPTNYDAVLGGQAPPPTHGVILGGIEGVEKRLATGLPEYQTAALNDALHYGEAGLKVILKSLQNTTGQVKLLAYSHLRTRSETWVKEALKAYNPYDFLQCINTLRKQGNLFNQVLSIALNPDINNQIIVCGTNSRHHDKLNAPRNWDVQEGKQSRFLEWSHKGEINCVVISPDGQRMISAGSDGYIAVWDFSTGKLLKKFKAHSYSVFTVVINPDGQSFASAGADDIIKIWDLHMFTELGTLNGHRHAIYALCFNESGKLLISGGNDQIIRIWDLRSRREVWKFEGHCHSIKSLAISPDGNILVSGSNQRIKVWDIQRGHEIFSLYGHADWVHSIVFSPDSRYFLSAGDVNIKVWDASMGKKLHSFQAHDDIIRSSRLFII
jgi:COMPASS component SWD3